MSAENEDDPRVVSVTHRPARVSGGVALTAAFLAVLSTIFGSILGFLVSFLGLIGLALGLVVFMSQRVALSSTGVIFLGVIISGLLGAPAEIVVFGALATILAFDIAQNAFSIGEQLSAQSETTYGEIVHVGASFLAGAVTVVLAIGIYTIAGEGYAIPALALLLLAGIALGWAIRQ